MVSLILITNAWKSAQLGRRNKLVITLTSHLSMDKRHLLFQIEPTVDTRRDRQAERESYRICRQKLCKKIARVDLRT